MTVNIPDWLARRCDSMRVGSDGSWYVFFGAEPQYRLKPIPVAGKFGCEIEQTVNSRRLDGKNTFATADEALKGGLEVLRTKLGW